MAPWMADGFRGSKTFAPVLVLLAICAVINYIDRGNLSIAAPLLKEELGISASQLGLLLSAFFWTYTALHLISGWMVDRFGANRLIAAGFLLWSLATAATGLVRGFAILLVMRLLLGIGESVMVPGSSKILSSHLPEHQRGFANGILQASWSAGPAVGTFGAALLVARYGWRPVFIGIGLISLLWLPAWIKWMPATIARERSQGGTPGFADILRLKSFWGASGGHFCTNYLAYFLLTWLPFYLVRERHLSMESMAKVAGAYYLIEALSGFMTGWLSDFFIRRGHMPTLVRKSGMVIGHTIAVIMLAGCAFANSQWYLFCLAGIGIGCGVARVGPLAFAQTLAGPQATGKWTGLQNGVSNLSGVVSPALAGFLVDRTGSFSAPLAITAAILVVGALLWVFAVGRVEEVHWKSESEIAPAAASTL